MNKFFISVLTALTAFNVNAQQQYAVTDVEGNVYKAIQIGNQIWMAENLRTTKYRDGTPIPNITGNSIWSNFTMGAYCWYNNNSSFKNPYGALYNYYTLTTGNICPTGWHVPSTLEWNEIEGFLGGMHIAGLKMKVNNDYWVVDGTNESGFSGLPSGQRLNNGSFLGIGDYCGMWISTNMSQYSCIRTLNNGNDLNGGCGSIKTGNSIRCIKNSGSPTIPSVNTKTLTNLSQNSANSGVIINYDGGSQITSRGLCWDSIPNPDITKNKTTDISEYSSFNINMFNLKPNTTYYVRAYAINNVGISYGNELNFKTLKDIFIYSETDVHGTVKDVENNKYKTVKIGTQTWMAENLKTTKLNDGVLIPLAFGFSDSVNTYSSAYYWYNNDSTNKKLYGAIYNYYPVESEKLCPNGWHVPVDDEWNILCAHLGDSAVGGKLKETGFEHWQYPNTGANNSSGFTALPGNYLSDHGGFSQNNWGAWWSASPTNYWYVDAVSENLHKYVENRWGGMSVRCLNDTSSLIVQVPEMETDTIILIDKHSAKIGSTISYGGGSPIIGKGVCWSSSPHPDTIYKTMDGSGVGGFISSLTGLTPNTIYYVRTYAINYTSVGYGKELSFKTLGNVDNNLQKGLVAYYPFNGNANDESGYNHHGVIDGATLTTDRFGNTGKAYLFNNNGKISISDFTLPSDSITICCWVKDLNPTGIQDFISKHTDIGDVELLIRSIDNKYTIEWTIGDTYFRLADDNGYYIIDPEHPRFDFLTLVYNGTIVNFYVNNQLIATRNTTGRIANNSLPMVFGRYAAGNQENFNGILDDIRLYNRALNPAEINALYHDAIHNNEISINTPEINAFENYTFEIPVYINNVKPEDKPIAYQFDLVFDSQKIQYQDYRIDGTLSENGSLQINPTSNRLSVAWAGQTPISESGTLIYFKFKAFETGITMPGISNLLLNTDTIKNITMGMIIIEEAIGDVDGNLVIQAYDAAITLQYSVGLDPLPEIDPLPWENWRINAANVDGMNGISAYDASLILQYTVGLIDSFPVIGYCIKSAGEPQADIFVAYENGNIVFRSSGAVKGLNVFIDENAELFGYPVAPLSGSLLASNYTPANLSVGLAMANPPAENEVILKIPVLGVPGKPLVLNLLINNREKQINLGSITGISENIQNTIEMYPNPAHTMLYFKNLPNDATITIYDMNGKKVSSFLPPIEQIDIGDLASGIYSIWIKSDNLIIIKKIIKD